MLTYDEIARVADDVLRANLGSLGFDRSEVSDDVDLDGEQAVRVTAHFKPGAGPADGKSALAALTSLRATLRQRGEERFPFLRYDYPDDDVPAASPEDFSA